MKIKKMLYVLVNNWFMRRYGGGRPRGQPEGGTEGIFRIAEETGR